MSRIGRKPIKVPSGVKISLGRRKVDIEGGKGKISWGIPDGIDAKLEDENILIERKNDEKKSKALHGLSRAVISNMVTGVSEGFSRTLEIVGVGYKAEALGKNMLKFSLGYSNPVEFSLPDGVSAVVEERGTRVIVQGIDKQVIGQTAARIRELRPPDSYKGKGIRYAKEAMKLKPGKAGAKG
jgi:large subunit ribosomal protein L6